MPTVVLTSVAYVAGAMLVAPVIQALVLADGLTAISLAIGRFLEEFTKRVGIYAVKEPIKKFSERFSAGSPRRVRLGTSSLSPWASS